jgi:hypothetical protein
MSGHLPDLTAAMLTTCIIFSSRFGHMHVLLFHAFATKFQKLALLGMFANMCQPILVSAKIGQE